LWTLSLKYKREFILLGVSAGYPGPTPEYDLGDVSPESLTITEEEAVSNF
jgi:hypothetical protein